MISKIFYNTWIFCILISSFGSAITFPITGITANGTWFRSIHKYFINFIENRVYERNDTEIEVANKKNHFNELNKSLWKISSTRPSC